jgi:hypothetical protein
LASYLAIGEKEFSTLSRVLLPRIVNNKEDTGLQTVVIGDFFLSICVMYLWLPGKDLTEHGKGYNDSEFADCH